MMFDPALTSVVLRQLIAAVSSWLRRRARRLGIKGALKTGAVTVIQRFNSALGASPHFHTLFLDGVYSFPLGRAPVFHPTPGPTDEERARGQSLLWGEAMDASGSRVVARLRGPEGYTLTMLAALAVVGRVLAGQAPPGFQTPSLAYGADFVLELPGVTRMEWWTSK